MKTNRVQQILLPYEANIPLNPWVAFDDRITEAIRKMLHHNVRRIAVIRKNRPIGVVRLEDALDKIGLEMGA